MMNPPSSETTGWYKCKVSSHVVDGVSTVIYPNQSTETLDLHLHKWERARVNTAAYLSPSKSRPHAAFPQFRKKMKEPKSVPGRPHCAKGFADNLSAISANKLTISPCTLDTIPEHSASLDLVLKPPQMPLILLLWEVHCP